MAVDELRAAVFALADERTLKVEAHLFPKSDEAPSTPDN